MEMGTMTIYVTDSSGPKGSFSRFTKRSRRSNWSTRCGNSISSIVDNRDGTMTVKNYFNGRL